MDGSYIVLCTGQLPRNRFLHAACEHPFRAWRFDLSVERAGALAFQSLQPKARPGGFRLRIVERSFCITPPSIANSITVDDWLRTVGG